MFVRTQTNGSRTYLLIVDNKWVRGKVKQHVLLRLGRLDELLASGQQSRWKIRAGPILALRVVMLSPRAWAPRTASFSENRPSDWISESSWPLASNSSRRPRRSRTCCLTLPRTHLLSTMSR